MKPQVGKQKEKPKRKAEKHKKAKHKVLTNQRETSRRRSHFVRKPKDKAKAIMHSN